MRSLYAGAVIWVAAVAKAYGDPTARQPDSPTAAGSTVATFISFLDLRSVVNNQAIFGCSNKFLG